MSLAERLKKARNLMGMDQQSMANFLGVGYRSWQVYESGKSTPGSQVIEVLVTKAGFNANWILAGEEPVFIREPTITKGFEMGSRMGTPLSKVVPLEDSGSMRACPPDPDYVQVPRYGVDVSAGPGSSVEGELVLDRLAFSRRWIKFRGLDPEKLAVVRVVGDSMMPTLLDGDDIMLDLRNVKPSADAIYVIEVAGDVRVKRLQPRIDGSIIIKSDNPAYETEIISAPDTERLRVLGRAVWAGKNL
jgi:phage repressor protein C with HTH and peptisase S24 domain